MMSGSTGIRDSTPSHLVPALSGSHAQSFEESLQHRSR